MDKNKKDYLSTTLLYQFFVCAILFGALFGLNKINPDYLKSIKSEFFDNIQSNSIIEKTPIINSNKNSEVKGDTNVIVTENSTKENANESTTEAEDALIPEVGAGGNDTKISDDKTIPSNVSVNNYVLNQAMVLPVNGTITSEYGKRIHPVNGNHSFHSGIDIAAEKGRHIKAAFDGVVVESEYDKWNGYHLKLQHDNGVMTVYCHCEKLLYKEGATVKAGETIATVGSTGTSTGPHLHFELRINDICYNPQQALDGAVNAV